MTKLDTPARRGTRPRASAKGVVPRPAKPTDAGPAPATGSAGATMAVPSPAGAPQDAAATSSAPKAPSAAAKDGEKRALRLDRTLAKLTTIEERIAAIAKAVQGRVAFSSSLGIEDQAVLNAIAAAAPARFDILTLDTGRHFQETLETLDESQRRYGIPIRLVAPDAREVEELVARDGVFGFRQAVENRVACCNIRKVRPLNRALEGASGWMTGLRRSQSDERAHVPFAAWDAEHGLIKINPIADWSLEQLEAYVAANNVPLNALHAKGFPSIGCAPCTRAIRPGEDLRAGRWWWENLDGKECGLHNRPQSSQAPQSPDPHNPDPHNKETKEIAA